MCFREWIEVRQEQETDLVESHCNITCKKGCLLVVGLVAVETEINRCERGLGLRLIEPSD